MTFLQAIILGIVQGLTEFLPVSSSAHLVFLPYLFHWTIDNNQMFVFNVLVQLGTLIAVMIYFAKDLWIIIRDFFKGIFTGKPFSSQASKMGWYLVLATIPAGLLGLLFKQQVEKVFASPTYAAVFLVVTAVLLVIGEKISTRRRTLRSFSWLDAVIMGAFQALSIFPGISRSGATISGGLLRKMDRPSAAKFSFLMSIPILLAAGLLGFLDLLKIPNLSSFLPKMIIGFLISGIVGFFVIHFFMKVIARSSFLGFAIYCAVVGITVLILSLLIYPSPVSDIDQSPQTMEMISVELPPSLSAFASTMDVCAQQSGRIIINYSDPAVNAVGSQTHFVISFSELTEGMTQYQIGAEDLVVIVNPENETINISSAELIQIYMGTMIQWDDSERGIEVYTYPSDTDIQRIFMNTLLNNAPITTLSHLVFTPQEMLSAIAADPSGVGIIPARNLDASIVTLRVDNQEAILSDIPILASPQEDLSVQAAEWIACLQNSE